jgi:hypothetical protein
MSESHPVDYKSYLWRSACAYVFIAVICATALMIWISFLPEHSLGVESDDSF